MRAVKIISGILLILLALPLSILVMLSTFTLVKSLLSIRDAYGVGFFIGTSLGYLLMLALVFFLIFFGIKLIRPVKKNVMERLNEL